MGIDYSPFSASGSSRRTIIAVIIAVIVIVIPGKGRKRLVPFGGMGL
jgi:hypothetical protein